jgi:hypothetical protein
MMRSLSVNCGEDCPIVHVCVQVATYNHVSIIGISYVNVNSYFGIRVYNDYTHLT